MTSSSEEQNEVATHIATLTIIEYSEKFRKKKEGQATHIAPLQPLTLAMFPSWGSLRELVV